MPLKCYSTQGAVLADGSLSNFPPPPVTRLKDWYDMICDEMRGSVRPRRWRYRCGIGLMAGRDEAGMSVPGGGPWMFGQGMVWAMEGPDGRWNGFITALSPQLLHYLDRFHGVFPMMASWTSLLCDFLGEFTLYRTFLRLGVPCKL